MSQNVAIFLDLDNLVIGARHVNLAFNIHHVVAHIKSLTGGRLVLCRAYGDARQNRELVRELQETGFILQTNIANNFGKNLADMQITVDAMESLVDGRPYHIYVLITGDQDFSPLAQALRKRDKYVIGIGVRHATSSTFASLCDNYLYYEDIVPVSSLDEAQVQKLLVKSLASLEKDWEAVRASLLKQRMDELSQGAFSNSSFAEGSFRKFLEQYPRLVQVQQKETTTYVSTPVRETPAPALVAPQHYLAYRTLLKKQKLRIIPAPARLLLLKEIINLLSNRDYQWRPLINLLVETFQKQGHSDVSKNLVNAALILARTAGVIHIQKADSLSSASVSLRLDGGNIFQKAVVLCDRAYLAHIQKLPTPFDLREASLALYDTPQYVSYLTRILPPIQHDS